MRLFKMLTLIENVYEFILDIWGWDKIIFHSFHTLLLIVASIVLT